MAQPKMVHCRYPKCSKLHESTELLKDEAVTGGSKNSYYHSDCYHTMQTINKIKDLFLKEVNPIMTGSQVGILVSVVNNMVFEKKIDIDYILFSLDYFIKYKPGKLHQPFGMHYIVQDKDVISAWKKEQDKKLHEKMKAELESFSKKEEERKTNINFDLPDDVFITKTQNKSKFSRVLGA